MPATVLEQTVNDVCDRHPSARAYTEWRMTVEGDGCAETLELTLCAHCANGNDLALVEGGFALAVDDRKSLEPQRTTHT